MYNHGYEKELQVMIGKELEMLLRGMERQCLMSAIGMDVHFIGILGEN